VLPLQILLNPNHFRSINSDGEFPTFHLIKPGEIRRN
jgi:hypothetical protein